MTLKAHKGMDEIGESCIKLKTDNIIILLDYGTHLKGTRESESIIIKESLYFHY